MSKPSQPSDRVLLLKDRHEALKERKRVEINRREIAVQRVATVTNATAEQITATVESIDAAWATSLLAKSTGNRPLRVAHIEWLATQMRTGQWRLTHQAVALSVSGRLLDGHHRLEAAKRAGVTVPMLVVRGLPDETWDAIDCGVVRAVHDRIELVPDRNRNRRIVEIIQQLRRIEGGARGKMTSEQVTADWNAMRDSLEVILHIFPNAIRGVTRAPMLGALARYHQRHPDEAIAFARGLVADDSAPKGHPANVLRQWLVDSSGFGPGAQIADSVYWTTVGCARLHYNGINPILSVERATAWWST